jgi:nicotinamidase-related amidase
MPEKNQDLHGSAPDRSPAALVIIDMINDMDFPGAEEMMESAVAAAERIAELKRRAHAAGIPVVYANDNVGRWRSDFREVVQHVLGDGVRGEPMARLLTPGEDDYFVLKPKHSAFFATTLETLLEYLGTTRLVLTGVSGDVCVLFTASDAHMRDFRLYVPGDCTASVSPEENRRTLEYMRRIFGADTTPSAELDLEALGREDRRKEDRPAESQG